MRVEGQERRAAEWRDDALHYLDQRALPHTIRFGVARDVEEVARAIEDMAVRGAPLIGIVAAYGLALAAQRGEPLAAARARLERTRPTAVNLVRGVGAVWTAAPDSHAMLAAAHAYDDAEVAAAEAIGRHGVAL